MRRAGVEFLTAFIDSHVHLADQAFDGDIEDVITRARASGARALVAIGESPDAAHRSIAIARQYPGFVFPTAGVHPHIAAEWQQERDLATLRQSLADGAVAVGECGLDYYYDHAPRDIQGAVLDAQLDLAADTAKPMVLHTREAETDTIAFLKRAASMSVRGVLHCFTGTPALAAAGIDAGWYVSFSGIITFRSWTDVTLLRDIPMDRLLVESDAPYLAPVPHRGKRNESAFVPLTLAHLAAVRSVDVDELAVQTIRNTAELFGLDLGSPDSFTNHPPTTT